MPKKNGKHLCYTGSVKDGLTLLINHEPSTWTYTPNTPKGIAIDHLISIVEEMVKHDLEASYIGTTKDGIGIVWEGGFNETRRIELMCFNTGLVVGGAIDSVDSTLNKIWWISGLSPLLEQEHDSFIILSLDETLEFVRHYIWADHKNI